jgi:hypothetical protein
VGGTQAEANTLYEAMGMSAPRQVMRFVLRFPHHSRFGNSEIARRCIQFLAALP